MPLVLVATMGDPVFVERQSDWEDDQQDHDENDWITRTEFRTYDTTWLGREDRVTQGDGGCVAQACRFGKRDATRDFPLGSSRDRPGSPEPLIRIRFVDLNVCLLTPPHWYRSCHTVSSLHRC